ncbi:MAG: DNA polymerase III subunit delta' [Myxococcaceae bacterium]|nr:DNA polymerase III subunit delta' [Myxococcaceae bacterium]
MALSEVHGQARAVSALERSLASGHVHHAWCFVGPEGVGKELAAVALTQALTCPEKPNVGCGTCSSCQRVLRRNHPDVTWVLTEDEQVSRGIVGRGDFDHTPSRDIKVEQVRALGERLAFRALESRHKVALLVDAHAMNPQAQNALLKTLEEPPKGTVLVLITSMPDKLLPTIRSRCSKAHFGPLPEAFLVEKIVAKKKIDAATAQQVARLSGGSLARAFELDVKKLEKRREIIEAFEALKRDDARGWLAFAENYGDGRVEAEGALDVLQVWLRDVLAAQAGAVSLVNSDLAELAQKAAGRDGAPAILRRMTVLDEARNAITARNGAVRLQLERMLIEMLA